MEKFSRIYENRYARVIEQMTAHIYTGRADVSVEAFQPRGEPVSPEEALNATYHPFSVGDTWGGAWNTAWFRITGAVPAEWEGRQVVALIALSPWEHIPFSGEGFAGEGLVWQNGKPVRAININRRDVPIASPAKGGETFEFYVEAAANPQATSIGAKMMVSPEPDGARKFTLDRAELTCFDREVWDLYRDYLACYEAMRALPEQTPRRGQLHYALNEASNRLDIENSETYEGARAALREVMSRTNSATTHTISAVGHAHIDTAWLWPLREAIRKCARTFSTALRYMEEYPDYKFSCSQAQHYAWMKHYYPSIYADIKKAIARGEWEPIGSMWIEVDCNIPSGESLVRQILQGKRFFEKELGVETTDVWIPDVFGYSASMPQIMKKAGIRYFMTSKISWNEINRFPHHTFLWEGIDGTRVFSHFPPADTYMGKMTGPEMIRCVSRFTENDRATRSLYPYGFGDGGGGPTRGMLETARRWKDFEGIPRVELDRVRDFFPKAEADAKDLPVWSGELYLEFHRGTYTSQAATKRGNRKCEFLLREAEFFDAVSLAISGRRPEAGEMPPHAAYDVVARDRVDAAGALERAWKLLLLNQFHDIIPGSSINWVYEDAARDYQTIEALGAPIVRHGQTSLESRIQTADFSEPTVIFNTLGFERAEVVSDSSGHPFWAQAPSCGYRVVEKREELPEAVAPVTVKQEDGEFRLENGLLRVMVDGEGRLSSVYDLGAKREVLAPGKKGNQFQLYGDTPSQWDAWDIEVFYGEVGYELHEMDVVEIVESGPLRAVLQAKRHFRNSWISQRIVLRAGSARIDFETEVDWQEERKLLKVAFPVNVRSPRATYEIQFGHTERPTHRNTSWDAAKFEVCAQKWADLSEGDYGVAILNDCKYGHDILDNVMRLSLLRAPNAPDPLADRGRHRFTYSLFPHSGGNPQTGGVIEEAFALNVPLSLVETEPHPGELPAVQSFFQTDRPGLMLDTVKVAEDADAVILRAYEAYGTRGPARIRTGLPLESALMADLLERPAKSLEMNDGAVEVDVSPFEIVTLKFPITN